MSYEKKSVSRVADREKLSLLLDKARQFAGEYIDSLEERPVFPGEKSLRAMDALVKRCFPAEAKNFRKNYMSYQTESGKTVDLYQHSPPQQRRLWPDDLSLEEESPNTLQYEDRHE
jgi:hypothetical protein